MFSILSHLRLTVVIAAMSIIGIVYVCNGEKKELPLIGTLRFIHK